MNIVLIYFAIKYDGDWDKIYAALESKESINRKDLITLEKELQKIPFDVTTVIDSDYPSNFKDAYKPPFVLWSKGPLELLSTKTKCLIGSPHSSSLEGFENSLSSLTSAHTLISPMSSSFEKSIVEKTSLPKILIPPFGLDNEEINSLYSDSDLLISEYPPTSLISKQKIKKNERIIAASSDSLFIYSSEPDEFTTRINSFLNIGKDIECVPGTRNNNKMINQGAKLIDLNEYLTTSKTPNYKMN